MPHRQPGSKVALPGLLVRDVQIEGRLSAVEISLRGGSLAITLRFESRRLETPCYQCVETLWGSGKDFFFKYM